MTGNKGSIGQKGFPYNNEDLRNAIGRPGGEWAMFDQMGDLDNYTVSELSDHKGNEKEVFVY